MQYGNLQISRIGGFVYCSRQYLKIDLGFHDFRNIAILLHYRKNVFPGVFLAPNLTETFKIGQKLLGVR